MSKSPYDYNYISNVLARSNKKTKGKKWTELATLYNSTPEAVRKWYSRELKRRIKKPTLKPDKKTSVRNEPYGKKPPTKAAYKGDIHDWVKEFTFFKWDMNYIREMREFIINTVERRERGLIFLPRNHGKSIASICVYTYLMLEKRASILVICSGTAAKNRLFRAVRSLLKAPKLRAYYGDIIESFNFVTGEMIAAEGFQADNDIDPLFRIVTRGGELIGSHPALATFIEDIIQEQFKSHESEEGLVAWFDSVVNYLGAAICGSATRKGLDDLYSKLRVRGFNFHVKRAVELLEGDWPTEGDLIYEEINTEYGLEQVARSIKTNTGKFKTLECPNFTLEDLLFNRTLNLASFESEMQNNPIAATGLYFDMKFFSIIEPFDFSKLPLWLFCDPAYGKTTGSDYFVILIVTVWRDSLIILDGEAKKGLTLSQQVARLHYWNYKAYNNQIRETVIESNFAQVWLSQEANKFLNNVVQYKQTMKKEDRIDALDLPFRQFKIHFVSTFPLMALTRQQLLQYDSRPSTALKKDDIPDTLATAFQYLRYKIKSQSLVIKSWS